MANTFLAVAEFAGRQPGLYLGGCIVVGSMLRLWMAHGDLGLFINPQFPVFIR